MTSLPEEEALLFDNYSYYEDDYPVYEEGDIPAIPLDGKHWPIRGLQSVITDQSELLVPVLVYSVTYITGLIGNILILVAVTGQKQVSILVIDKYVWSCVNLKTKTHARDSWIKVFMTFGFLVHAKGFSLSGIARHYPQLSSN